MTLILVKMIISMLRRKIRNIGDYHDLYLKTDVLLLADVFENFRETCLNHYRLDPAHYMTSPGLSCDAMLKMTEIKLDLISDIECNFLLKRTERRNLLYLSSSWKSQ